MTPAEESKVRQAIAGIDTALDEIDKAVDAKHAQLRVEREVRRTQRALDNGVSIEVVGELNRLMGWWNE